MTTIVFYKDVLYTDSRHVLHKKGHVPSLIEDRPQGKVYGLSLDGEPVAYVASCDKAPTLLQRNFILASIMKGSLAEKMELLSISHMKAAEKGETNTYGSTFVVTADNVFRVFRDSLVKEKEDNDFPRIVEHCDDMDWPISYGTGMYFASGYLVSGGDPRKLMEFVSRHDSLTGPHTFAYHRKHLKAISANETRDVYKTVAKGCK